MRTRNPPPIAVARVAQRTQRRPRLAGAAIRGASTTELTEAPRPRLQALQQRLALGRRMRQQPLLEARVAMRRRVMAGMAAGQTPPPRPLAQKTVLPLRSRPAEAEETANLGPPVMSLMVMEAAPLRPPVRMAERMRVQPEEPPASQGLRPPRALEARHPQTRRAEDPRSPLQLAVTAEPTRGL